jgi:hypothetical protein
MEFISADHIAAQSGAFEPQRKNNFTLRIKIPGGGDEKVIQRSLDSFPFPKEGNDPILVNFGNETRKVAGIAKFEDCVLVLKDFADQPVMKDLIGWRRKVYDPVTGKIGLAKDYKSEGTLVLMAPDYSILRKWKLQGVWPSHMDPGGGDMNSNTNNTMSITLTIDKAVEDKGFK